ncbi:predicted protein [Lichtheimia corymbifera JMRC:FSU:9682]|uniref:60s acidic ribosomal protein p2 n=1 Tax=Lichtheimia corymbifera JMRC:FSU:9682 TaxID=1263082 RepID=A0A068RI68_9FUNG|nr:predicted protein [Lichtheimia corymbifera JMRC:FSU:9682]
MKDPRVIGKALDPQSRWTSIFIQIDIIYNEVPRCLSSSYCWCSVGVEAEDERISALIAALKDKDVNEVLAEGKEKLASVPTGGAVAAGGAAAGGAAEEAKEEAKEEEKEESDEDMGFGLFD